MAAADAEIEADFAMTQDEIERSRQRDWDAKMEALPHDKAKEAAQNQARYEAKKAKVAARLHAWYVANKDTVRARQKAYCEKNKEAVAAYKHDWYIVHKAQCRLREKEYRNALRAAGPTEGMLAIHAARKAIGLTQIEFGALFGRSGGTVSRWETVKAPAYWRDIVRRAELERAVAV